MLKFLDGNGNVHRNDDQAMAITSKKVKLKIETVAMYDILYPTDLECIMYTK